MAQPTEEEIAQAVIDFTPTVQKATEIENRLANIRRHPDVLTLCGMLVRSRDIPAWEKLTLQQRVNAIVTETAAYAEIRCIVESNFNKE